MIVNSMRIMGNQQDYPQHLFLGSMRWFNIKDWRVITLKHLENRETARVALVDAQGFFW